MVLQNNKIGLFQRHLMKKFADIETAYYLQIDELTQKLGDMDLATDIKIPDFTMQEFSFITQWEQGLMSSGEVCDIFEVMDIHQASKSKLTKRLINFMMDNDSLADYIKPVIAGIENDCMENMEKYLVMMQRYFVRMDTVDQSQIEISWVEQIFDDGEVLMKHHDMPLNQAIKHIETFILKDLNQKFYIQDQIIVFDEDLGHDDRIIHWIFAPRTYIELMKVIFEIRETLTDEDSVVYLKKLMGNFTS